jgi:DNA helicase-2/ATP-dependent DNA helicase PcrA
LEEVEIVANKIAELRRREGLGFSDFAILYRTNAQSRVFEEAFRRRGFPYRIFGGLSFYQRKEVKDVIAYFRLICNKDDEEAFKRIINYPARGIGDKTVQKVKDIAIERGMSLWQVLADPFLCGLDVNKGTLAKLMQFTGMIDGFYKLSEEKNAIEVARAVVKDSGIREELYRDMSVEGKSRQENLEALMAAIEEFVDMHLEEGNEHNSLADFLSEVSLMSDLDNDDSGDGERITLMTVHSAKGLEFPTVFVVGLEEDLFPNSGARESLREMEEERRLLYVAITRAKDHCILSFAKSRYKFGQFGFCEPSCFIKEINSAYIVMPNGGAVQQRQQQPSYRSGGMFGATNNNYGRRSSYNYGQEESGRPQFSRTGGASTNRTAEPQRASTQAAGTSTYTSRPTNLYRVSDVQRYGQGSAGDSRLAVKVGVIVQHDRFGVGEVQSTEGLGDNAKATIKFQNAGVKTLLLKFAKLKIIG